MRATLFFRPAGPISLRQIADLTGARLVRGDPDTPIFGASPREAAGSRDLTYLDYLDASDAAGHPDVASAVGGPAVPCLAAAYLAVAYLADERQAAAVPATAALLTTPDPRAAYLAVLRAYYPDTAYAGSYNRRAPAGVAPGAVEGRVHPSAELEANVVVEPGAVVGADAVIGRDTIVGAGAVVGTGVKVGRACTILPNASIDHALIGDRVVVRPGARIGQEGLDPAPGHDQQARAPQIGRVIIQDDVEVGANSCIDRGEAGDTVVGEGTIIGNLVQVGAGATIGRRCTIGDQASVGAAETLPGFTAVDRRGAIGAA